MIANALQYSHHLLKELVQPGDHVIDATVGNGYDTLFLAQLVGETGIVYGFDIQEKAMQATTEKLTKEHQLAQVRLYQQGHETIATLLPKQEAIKAAIFNLGYLPKSDKSIVTHAETTILAIQGILPHLEKSGQILLMIYYGHEGGLTEKNTVTAFAKDLSQEAYTVLCYQFVNQQNQPPILLVIEKK